MSVLFDNLLPLAACTGLAIVIVRRYDLSEQEPQWLIAVYALAGWAAFRLAAEPLGELITTCCQFLPLSIAGPLVAAVLEDLLKLVCVAGLMIPLRQHANDPIDGLLYGVAVGIGMAIEEFVSSFDLAAGWIQVVGDLLVRSAGHLIFGAIICFPLTLHCCAVPLRPLWLRLAWVLCPIFVVLLHFAWDLVAEHSQQPGWSAAALRGLAVALMLAGFFAFFALVVIGAALSKARYPAGPPLPPIGRRFWRFLQRRFGRPGMRRGLEVSADGRIMPPTSDVSKGDSQ